MTALHLPGLEPETQRREKIRKRVRPTSVAAYADGRERFTGRKAEVLRWLAHYINRWQQNPTSAELAAMHPDFIAEIDAIDPTPWGAQTPPNFNATLTMLLYVRRGISDLQTAGVVEAVPQGKRLCRESKRVCETWRIVPAGRTR